MQTITLVMIVYCAIFAGLVLGFAIYRAMKRRHEMRAFAQSQTAVSQTAGASLPHRSATSETPHDTPSAKHAA